MPQRIVEAAKNIAPIMDAKTGWGIGVSLSGLLTSLTEWAPVIGTVVSICVGIATFIYIRRGTKLRNLEIKQKQRELGIEEED